MKNIKKNLITKIESYASGCGTVGAIWVLWFGITTGDAFILAMGGLCMFLSGLMTMTAFQQEEETEETEEPESDDESEEGEEEN